MLFLEYSKCSTCQKAKKWLKNNQVEFELRDIKEQNPTVDELREWYKISGLELKKFFNTSGMLYKEMGLKDKLKTMTEEEQLQLLSSDGMLVKRPILIKDQMVILGFKEEAYEKTIK